MARNGKKRVPRSEDDLRTSLQIQLELLQDACVEFDKGRSIKFYDIANRLRLLWHDEGRAKSLLGQLRLKQQVPDTAFDLPPEEVIEGLPEEPSREKRLFAMCGEGFSPLYSHGPEKTGRLVSFSTWWGESVLFLESGTSFTRGELVLMVANQDGGAHIDPTMEKRYYDLTRNSMHGIKLAVPTVKSGTYDIVPGPPPLPSTIRQIAHETFLSLDPAYSYDGSVHAPGLAIAYIQTTIRPSGGPIPSMPDKANQSDPGAPFFVGRKPFSVSGQITAINVYRVF